MIASVEPIKVVLYTQMYDTGGQGWKIKRAFDRYFPEEFSVRSIVTHKADYGYPTDLVYKPESAYELFAQADIVHMRNGLEGLSRLLGQRPADSPPPGLIVHHHGSRLRQWYYHLLEEARQAGATQLVSTLDLALLSDDLRWLPAPFNLEELARYRLTERPTGPIRIAHSPTNREVKSTARILAAIQSLAKSGYDITFDLIERQSWDECLRRKGLADIVIDQLELGIGNSALEAFGMGIPVVAGVSSLAVHREMIDRWGALPFYIANSDNLEERLAHLIRNYELRAQVGAAGLEYLSTFHEEYKVASQLANIYRSVAARSSLAEGVA